MTNSIKKKLQSIIKKIAHLLFFFIYGRIKGVIDCKKHQSVEVCKVNIDGKNLYNLFKIKNCRVYTDTVTDTAFIIHNQIIEGPSFQHRAVKNSDIKDNIVFKKGTPRIKKKLKGSTFSLLTGGGGNSNYWHWLFDVLPRIKLIEKNISLNDIDFFLFPDINEKFQIETLDLLKISNKKRLSSKKVRHFETDLAISVDHPYVIKNDPSIEIQNMPKWIIEFLKQKFLKFKSSKIFPKKIYIDRKDAKSNHSHLRKIINEDEVKEFLVKNGFEIFTLGEMSFIDQISLFNNASQIIGLHGAGFANLIFCRPETHILELKPFTAGPVCGNLAKNNNLNYNDISIKPSGNSNSDQQGHIIIPLNLLEKKII